MLAPGREIAGYRLLAPLGKGGQGEVHRALAPWGAEVALKILGSGPVAAESAAVGRFRREMRLLCSIDHPRVLKAYATGEADGRLWIACELAGNGNLAAHLHRRGRLEVGEALGVLGDLFAGLIALADAGIAHRDVKPANLLGFPDGWKLGDLGMARRYDPDGSSWTGSGMVVGTAAYLAPELVCGEPADFASDAYAAGCVFYEMLAGEPPFRAADPMAVMQQHLDAPIPDPEKRGLPRVVADLIRDLMAKGRHRRLADPAEVMACLDEVRRKVGMPGMVVPERPVHDDELRRIEIAPTTTLIQQPSPKAAQVPGMTHARIGLMGRLRLHVWAGSLLTVGRDRDPGSGRHARLVLLPESAHASENRRISGRHLAFAINADGATVEDTGSSWGTTLDGVRLRREPQALRDGAVLVLAGVLELRIRVLEGGGLLLRRSGNAADLAYLLLAGAVGLDAEAQGPGEVLRLTAAPGHIAWADAPATPALADGGIREIAAHRYRVFDLSADDEF